MTPSESRLLKEFVQRQEDFNETHAKNMQKILRGLYGEEENDTIGLVVRVSDAEKKIKKHENLHRRVGYSAAGFILAIEGVWHGVKALFLER